MNLPVGGILPAVKLSERVRWVVENLPISESAWSLKAGQSRGYVQKLIKRDPLRPDFNALQRMAEHAEEVRDGDGPEGLARGQGVDVEFDDGFPDGHDGLALYEDKLLIVRPSRDRATEWLRILHELAHWMLMAMGWAHSHGDVWMLALALGAPKSLMQRERPGCAVALAAASGLPAWASAARMEMLDAA